MSKNRRARREVLFGRGAAAIQRLTGISDEVYVCPLCLKGFVGREILRTDLLTVDHVPAKAVGGRTTILTCRDCNSTAGHALEAQVQAREKAVAFWDAVLGRPTTDVMHVMVELMGGEKLRATFTQDGDAGRFEILADSNDPGAVARVQEHIENLVATGEGEGTQIKATMTRGFHGRRALVGDLKAAYLIAFAAMGYSYALHPVLNSVRRQITDPQAMIIPPWWVIPGLGENAQQELAACTVSDVMPPLEFLCVRLKRSTIFLPWPNGGDIYAARAAAVAAGENLPFRGWTVPWPETLDMRLDFLEADKQHRLPSRFSTGRATGQERE